MPYPTLMVHLDLGVANDDLLKFTAAFAERCHARVIGISTCQPMLLDFSTGVMVNDLIEIDRTRIDQDARQAEASFDAALAGRAAGTEWRSLVSLAVLSDYICEQARSADLIITGPGRKGAGLEPTRHVDIGDLVLHAGRPVMIVPPGVDALDLRHVLVGWKDTREARRAVLDSLPLLRMAERVTVAEIASNDGLKAATAALRDVAAWLDRHGIAAEHQAIEAAGDDAAQLQDIAADEGAGVLVAGAYGHSRMREWMFGGVSRELLQESRLCSLLSH